MGRKSQVKGQHGLGARGQGKLLHFHTRISHTVRGPTDPLLAKRRQAHDRRRPDGHWAP